MSASGKKAVHVLCVLWCVCRSDTSTFIQPKRVAMSTFTIILSHRWYFYPHVLSLSIPPSGGQSGILGMKITEWEWIGLRISSSCSSSPSFCPSTLSFAHFVFCLSPALLSLVSIIRLECYISIITHLFLAFLPKKTVLFCQHPVIRLHIITA